MRYCLLISSLALIASLAAGCGIKPKELSPPKKGAEDIEYPRTYPAPANDPH